MAGIKGRTGVNGKGKAGSKRTPAAIEEDRAEMMRLLRKGWSKTRIAEKLGVHRTQVTYDYKIILSQLKKEMTEDGKALIAIKLEQLAHLYAEALTAWEISKTSRTIENIDGSTTTIQSPGKVEYLREALAIWKAECELRGLYPAKETRVQGTMIHTEIGTDFWDTLMQGLNGGAGAAEIEAKIVEGLELPALPAPDCYAAPDPTMNGSSH